MNPVTVDRIAEMYPQSWKMLVEWYRQQIAPAKTNIAELDQINERPLLNTEKILRNMMAFTIPRFLYDFLDGMDVKMFVCENMAQEWIYTIAKQQYHWEDYLDTFTCRSLAEEAGFLEAFRILDNRLTIEQPVASE